MRLAPSSVPFPMLCAERSTAAKRLSAGKTGGRDRFLSRLGRTANPTTRGDDLAGTVGRAQIGIHLCKSPTDDLRRCSPRQAEDAGVREVPDIFGRRDLGARPRLTER